jgi:SAM-dependent methyltransferase
MTSQPGRYGHLDFNAPLSDERATRIATALAAAHPRTVLDVGCGWGELLLRVVAAAADATGTGVDRDLELLDRGRANAKARGIDDRVRFVEGDAAVAGASAEVVLCVGSDHVFGTQAEALAALRERVTPGGRLLFGTGFWTRQPGAAEAAAVGMERDDLPALAELVDLAVSLGFRPLSVRTATCDEWEAFESGYLADWEEWLMDNPSHPDADAIRAKADRHRTEWLSGYRDVLGFAYLILGRPRVDG